jgi:hypothetical protein
MLPCITATLLYLSDKPPSLCNYRYVHNIHKESVAYDLLIRNFHVHHQSTLVISTEPKSESRYRASVMICPLQKKTKQQVQAAGTANYLRTLRILHWHYSRSHFRYYPNYKAQWRGGLQWHSGHTNFMKIRQRVQKLMAGRMHRKLALLTNNTKPIMEIL